MYLVKLTIFLIFTLCLAVLCLPLLIIFYPLRSNIGLWMAQFYSLISLKIFGVVIEAGGKKNVSGFGKKGIILTPNHTSYLDIFILSSLFRTTYVSKMEVIYYPLIGQIAWLIGIIFLKRSSAEERHKIIRKIADKANEKIITVFPQGTTGSSMDPVPFKCGIFKTFEINRNIVFIPVTIHYKEEDEIAWTGSELLFHNIKKVCSQNRIHVKVVIHQKISFENYGNKTISEICEKAQDIVLSELKNDY